MSGHDWAAKPHKTTHEMVIDCVRGGVEGHAGARSARTPVRQLTAQAGIKPGPLTQSIAVQWVRWPNVKPREWREKRQGPRNGSMR